MFLKVSILFAICIQVTAQLDDRLPLKPATTSPVPSVASSYGPQPPNSASRDKSETPEWISSLRRSSLSKSRGGLPVSGTLSLSFVGSSFDTSTRCESDSSLTSPTPHHFPSYRHSLPVLSSYPSATSNTVSLDTPTKLTSKSISKSSSKGSSSKWTTTLSRPTPISTPNTSKITPSSDWPSTSA